MKAIFLKTALLVFILSKLLTSGQLFKIDLMNAALL